MILGIIGDMGSGKSTAATYLKEKYGASHYRFSDILREVLDLLLIPATRHNLIDLFLVLEPRFGANVLARPMAKAVAEDPNPLIVIEGIRREADIEELCKLPNFYLIGLTAHEKIRYQRTTIRGEKTDDNQKSFAEFQKDHELKTETNISMLMQDAFQIISNNGKVEDLTRNLDKLINELQK